jgi:hypothetical protein
MRPSSHPLRCGLLRGSTGHAAGVMLLCSERVMDRPASRPLLPLRDGLRFAHEVGSVPFPLLPCLAAGSRGNSMMGYHHQREDSHDRSFPPPGDPRIA